MSTQGLFNVDSITIDEINIIKAGIENNTDLNVLEKGKHNFDITFGFTPGINIHSKKFRIVFHCELKPTDLQNNKLDIKGYFDIVFIFNVDNLDQLVKINESKLLEIDNQLIATISNIIYSTSRGIIYTRCQGTILRNIIMPIVSTEKLVDILAPKG